MDEFHSFNDPERGIVWEFSLGLLPPHVRLLLLSATVGNAMEFVHWLRQTHHRKLELVQSDERKVPLTFQWVGDALLTDHVEQMAQGDESTRLHPRWCSVSIATNAGMWPNSSKASVSWPTASRLNWRTP